jgi:internalin A
MTKDELLIIIQQAKQENTKSLNLSAKNLTEFPIETFQLEFLTDLYLQDNKLKSIPVEIKNLRFLERLLLHNNQIENIPPEISQLKKLKYLTLSKNRLKNIPIEITKLGFLEILALSNNKIKTLPAEIYKLEFLKVLGLSNNQLESIPDELGKLEHLFLVDLRNNPINTFKSNKLVRQGNGVYVPAHAPQLPDDFLQQQYAEKVYYYLTAILEQENRALNEAKLILVGEGAVGKTSLVNKLIFDTYNDKEIKTEGINRELWRLPLGETQYETRLLKESITDIVRVNVWDFGGQEILHATHQFFLTKRSLYILVLDARRGEQESRLEYWLKLIQSFGSGSPIIVVINKIDEQLLNLNTRFLQRKYPGIQDFCNISCKTGKGINELKEKITAQIAKLEDVKTPLPQTWFELKGALENLHDNYISYTRYEQLCEQYGITEKDDQKTLLGLLHDLGIILNFQDDDRFDHLRETNVLNPDWVTNGVYKLLNNLELFKSHGVFAVSDLAQMLDTAAYPTMKEHQFIIDMMQKFELCFPITDTQSYLIPDLLQNEEPDLNWPKDDSLRFRYHYDILPHSVFSRFIVRLHTYISQSTYWRTGVVLAYEASKALIKADLEDKKIFVWVTGKSLAKRRELLAIIRKEFKHIHSTIKGLDAQEFIPLSENSKAVIAYEDLLDLEANDITEYYYPPIKAKINVPELLAGVDTKQKLPQGGVYIENQHIHGGEQQFADNIKNED